MMKKNKASKNMQLNAYEKEILHSHANSELTRLSNEKKKLVLAAKATAAKS